MESQADAWGGTRMGDRSTKMGSEWSHSDPYYWTHEADDVCGRGMKTMGIESFISASVIGRSEVPTGVPTGTERLKDGGKGVIWCGGARGGWGFSFGCRVSLPTGSAAACQVAPCVSVAQPALDLGSGHAVACAPLAGMGVMVGAAKCSRKPGGMPTIAKGLSPVPDSSHSGHRAGGTASLSTSGAMSAP